MIIYKIPNFGTDVAKMRQTRENYLEGILFICEEPSVGKGRYNCAGKEDEDMGNNMTI